MNKSPSPSLLQVNPLHGFSGEVNIPSSKPETQRAIIAATLASGVSIIYNDLRCLETETMKNACRNIGAIIHEKLDHLEIHGIGGNITPNEMIIDALGSGLVFRIFAALSCFTTKPLLVTGDEILCGRVMHPLFKALEQLGGCFTYMDAAGHAPIKNYGGGLKGGSCDLPGNVSSQFITAIMLAAPFAERPTKIMIQGEILSISYIRQTIDILVKSGIQLTVTDDYSLITIYPGEYKPRVHHISGDYTSSSYLIAAATIFPGKTILKNMNSMSLQGEKEIINIVEALGVQAIFDDIKNTLTLINNNSELSGEYKFDARDCPNIVPTLAAIGAFVKGTFKVVGGSITRHHKSSRIKAIVSELSKIGVDIKILSKNGTDDGFEIKGKSHYQGNAVLSSWGDHRIFMSLYVVSLRCHQPNNLEGHEDVNCSFPNFLSEFNHSNPPVVFNQINAQDVFLID